MPRFYALLLRTGALGIAMVVLFGCGGTSTAAQGVSTATAAATATNTPPPTPTPKPTATPTPGHLLVTIIPNPKACSGSGCNPYVCHNGTTCNIDGPCTSPAWPTLKLSNSGQASLKWKATLTQYNSGAPPWSLSATQGTLAGGAATNVTITNGAGGGGMQVVFAGGGQTVTLSITCGAG